MNIGLGHRRRTILLIDADAHARATLRKALEAADFSVGEAANNREGERTVLRIKPDAILAELMTEPTDAGMTISRGSRQAQHDPLLHRQHGQRRVDGLRGAA